MKFAIGDLVIVREDLEPYRSYGEGLFTPEMEPYKGRLLEVTNIKSRALGTNLYELDFHHWRFSEEMLELAVFTKNDLEDLMICEVRNGYRYICLNGELGGSATWCIGTRGDLTNTLEQLDVVTVYEKSDRHTICEMLRHPGRVIWRRAEEPKFKCVNEEPKFKWVDVCRIIKRENDINKFVCERVLDSEYDLEEQAEEILKQYKKEHEGTYFAGLARNCVEDK